ncbi:MAG TPA: hypothetical protein VK939_18345, partial [Longimicrobiales bacterium]|nr:hypothetical protein [Longimicrobiales bacterium]
MECQIRGMGRVTGLATQTLTFTPTGILVENTAVYTTPNGDELHSTFSGLGVPDQSQTVISLPGTERRHRSFRERERLGRADRRREPGDHDGCFHDARYADVLTPRALCGCERSRTPAS